MSCARTFSASSRPSPPNWSAGSTASRQNTVAELVCAADDPRRLAERRGGVTATDMSVILGLATWNSPYGLWWDKTSPEPRKPVDTDRFRLGRMLKPYIVDRWQEEHPLGDWEIRSGCPGLLRSSDRPWQLATPDRLLLQLFPPHPPVFTAVLEVKSWADADRSSWEAGPPPVVRAQVLWQMDVMNVTSGHVGVVFLPSGEFRSYVIELCDESCGWREDIAFLREEGHEFYRRMTGELPPPSVDGSAATLAALRARFTPAEGPAADIPADLWDL